MNKDSLPLLRTIETFADFPMDQKNSFRIYLGRNIPKENIEDEQVVVTEEELSLFFDTQETLTGLTKVDCEGIWKGEREQSIIVIAFDVTLREVVKFSYEYMQLFLQQAVYIECSNTKTIELYKEIASATIN